MYGLFTIYNTLGRGHETVGKNQDAGERVTKEQEANIAAVLKDRPRVRKALRDSVQKALRIHKAMGVPWRDGKVVEIPPEQIELLDEGNGKSTP
jgi:hypothetical protein